MVAPNKKPTMMQVKEAITNNIDEQIELLESEEKIDAIFQKVMRKLEQKFKVAKENLDEAFKEKGRFTEEMLDAIEAVKGRREAAYWDPECRKYYESQQNCKIDVKKTKKS